MKPPDFWSPACRSRTCAQKRWPAAANLQILIMSLYFRGVPLHLFAWRSRISVRFCCTGPSSRLICLHLFFSGRLVPIPMEQQSRRVRARFLGARGSRHCLTAKTRIKWVFGLRNEVVHPFLTTYFFIQFVKQNKLIYHHLIPHI